MHTPNKGLSTCLRSVLCLLHVSYKSVPFPPFPSRFPFPLFPSLVPFQKQPVVFVTYISPLLSKSVHSLPSSSLPTVPFPLSLLTIMSPPFFPIDDYVPALLSYFRLCSLFLSLFLIMPWHSLSLMSLCYFCKIVGNAILCSKYLSERTGQLLFMHKNYVLKCHIIFSAGEPSWIMGARALLK